MNERYENQKFGNCLSVPFMLFGDVLVQKERCRGTGKSGAENHIEQG